MEPKMDSSGSYGSVPMKKVYYTFELYHKLVKSIRTKEFVETVLISSKEKIQEFKKCLEIANDCYRDIEQLKKVVIVESFFPQDLVISPFKFLASLFAAMVTVSEQPEVSSDVQQNCENAQAEFKSYRIDENCTIADYLYCYVVVESMKVKTFRQLEQSIRKQIDTFEITSGTGYYLATKTLLSFSQNYIQLLLSVFSGTYKGHFPLFKSGLWLSPASSLSFKTMEITEEDYSVISDGFLLRSDTSRKRKNDSSAGNTVKVVVKTDGVETRVPEEEENKEDDYPHHPARQGNRYQAVVNDFDLEKAKNYDGGKMVYEQLWNPERLTEEELDKFTSQFPQDIMEEVYDAIMRNNYDLKKSYEDLLNNPPANPITQYSPEDEKKLEDNIDNMAVIHHNYFPHVRIQDVVNLFYHMDVSFKDDVCTICSSAGSLIFCSKCPRGFHKSCIKIPNGKDFICPFCLVTKESLSPNEIDRILTKYRIHIGKKNEGSGRSGGKKFCVCLIILLLPIISVSWF